jgi:ABC-type branched-subunit amino acid transport system permease subunit
MSQYQFYRFGFHFLFAYLFAFVTGCKSESFNGQSGSGYKIGIVVAPAAAILAAILAGLLGYFVWRRISKQ